MIIRKKYKKEYHRGTIIEEITLTEKEELVRVFKEIGNLGYRWKTGTSLREMTSLENSLIILTIESNSVVKIYLLDDKTVLYSSNWYLGLDRNGKLVVMRKGE